MRSSRCFVTFALLAATRSVAGKCEALEGMAQMFGETDAKGVADLGLHHVQQLCGEKKCPTIDFAGCKNQSVDDIACSASMYSGDTKIGTDAICNSGCSSWPCKAGCEGIDVGICEGSDYILCKAGCLGIHSCVTKCEDALVKPCRQKLIHECSDKCEAAFQSCSANCQKELTMTTCLQLQRAQGAVSSMILRSLDTNCTGDAIQESMKLNASADVLVTDLAVDLKVRTEDIGIGAEHSLQLRHVSLDLVLPFVGEAICNDDVEAVNVTVGTPVINIANLNADFQLDSTLQSIANVICVGLPVCKDAIKTGITRTIKKSIYQKVPAALAGLLKKVLQDLAKGARCPNLAASRFPHGVVVL